MPPTVSPESIGYERGLRDGLHDGLRAALRAKFGGQGDDLFDDVRWMKDLEVLRTALDAIEDAETPEEWRRAWCAEMADGKNFASFVSCAERAGFVKGLCKGLLSSIEAVLDVKFGAAGLRLMPEFRPLRDVEKLRALLRAVKAAASVDDVKRAWST
jgi:hypothetical protein